VADLFNARNLLIDPLCPLVKLVSVLELFLIVGADKQIIL